MPARTLAQLGWESRRIRHALTPADWHQVLDAAERRNMPWGHFLDMLIHDWAAERFGRALGLAPSDLVGTNDLAPSRAE